MAKRNGKAKRIPGRHLGPAVSTWTDDEWFSLMQWLVPYRDRTHDGLVTSLQAAQEAVLPPLRRRTLSGLNNLRATGIPRDYEARFRNGWKPEAEETPEAPPPVAPAEGAAPAELPTVEAVSKAPHPRHGTGRIVGRKTGQTVLQDRDALLESTFTSTRVHWTEREWNQVALAVQYRIDRGDTRSLARIFFETQVFVLPLDRCRPRTSFASLPPLQRHYDDALRQAWTLPQDISERLIRTGKLLTPEDESYGVSGPLLETVHREIEPPMPEPQADAHADTPPPASPVETPAKDPAPQASPGAIWERWTAPTEADPLASSIAAVIAGAAASIADLTRQAMTSRLDSLIASMAQTMRSHVHELLEHELGALTRIGTAAPAPVEAPPAPREPAPRPAEEPARARAIRVDIVGLLGSNVGVLKQYAEHELPAPDFDVRFIEQDKSNTWAPGQIVILATKFVSHKVRERAEKAGSHLIFANAGAQSVRGALESIKAHPPEVH